MYVYMCGCVFVCLYAWMHSNTVGDIETKPSQVAGGFSAGGRRVGGDPGVAPGGPQGPEIKTILPGTLKSCQNELWLDVGPKTWQPGGGFSCSGHKGRMTPGRPLRGSAPKNVFLGI